MSDRPSIEQQIDEVRLVILNRRAWLDRREALLTQGKTVPPDTGCTASSMPGLEAALRTLEWVRDHADALRVLPSEEEAA